MNDSLNDLKNRWDEAKKAQPVQTLDPGAMIALSREKLKRTVNMLLGNIIVLVLTLVGISSYFLFVAHFQETISHIGIALMTGGLLIRIAIEFYSIYRSSKVNVTNTAAAVNEETLNFHSYRKRIHGPITIGILFAYTLGFYLLTPEFADYFTTTQIILLDTSYLLAAAIFGYSIKRAISKEMTLLDELKDLQGQLTE